MIKKYRKLNKKYWKSKKLYPYKNYSLLKKNKHILLSKNNKCAFCGKQAKIAHHKDLTTTNHDIPNLILLCYNCHSIYHHSLKKTTSKYRKIYGMTLKEMSIKYGGCASSFLKLHRKKLLHSFLKNGKLNKVVDNF